MMGYTFIRLILYLTELVDCDKLDDGCKGGLPDNAYRALEQLGGLELEQDYPYDGRGESCTFNKTLTRVQVHGAVNISSNETDMAKWLLQNGPIAIGINANAMQVSDASRHTLLLNPPLGKFETRFLRDP